MKVERWGYRLAVRLPDAMVEALGLKEDDDIEIDVTTHKPPSAGQQASREELIARLRTFRGRLPKDFKFDRDEANSR